jgi:hypothetical protein
MQSFWLKQDETVRLDEGDNRIRERNDKRVYASVNRLERGVLRVR